jgi:pSer/pThr/pTyr-binding forkhead associated (FHA) protein
MVVLLLVTVFAKIPAHSLPNMAFVRITLEDGTLTDCQLDAKTLSIGRHPDNDLILQDTSISSRHAELRRERDGVWVKDLGSTNKTRVNGEDVDEILLTDRDKLLFGDLKAVFYEGRPDEIDEEPEDEETATTSLQADPAKEQLRKLPVAETMAVHLKADDGSAIVASSPTLLQRALARSERLGGRKGRQSGPVRPKKSAAPDQPGLLAFLFVAGFFVSMTLGLTVKHYTATGGFLPAEIWNKFRFIEIRRAGEEPEQERRIRGR